MTHAPAFEEMLARVYENDPGIKSERENLLALDEHVSQANAGFRPSAAIASAIGEARVSENNEAWRYGQDRNLAFTVTQPIYNGSTNGQRYAAKARVMEGRARLMAAEQKALFTAIAAWLDVYEKERLLSLNQNNLQLMQNYLLQTQQRFSAGDSTQTDIAVAESRGADADTRSAMARAALDTAYAAYIHTTGFRAQAPELPSLPANLPASLEETLQLAKNNPQLAQAEQEVKATEKDIETASGSRWPFIYLRGSISDETAADLGLSNLRNDSITINASIPLYQGGIEYSHVREARIAHEKSRYDSMAVERSVNEEAMQAWSRFREAQAVIQAANKAAEASDRALAGISEEQKHGTRTLTEVLDAQSQSVNARLTVVQAEKDLRLEAYRLLAAVGRLSARGLNLPTTLYDPEAHYNDVASRWFGTDSQ